MMLYDSISTHILRSGATSSTNSTGSTSTSTGASIGSSASTNTRRTVIKGVGRGRSSQSTPSVSPSRTASPAARMEQSFHLAASGHSSPWLTLRVRSNAPQSKSHPLYFDKDTVEGSVDLDLSDSPTTIVGIVVIVRGQVYSVNSDQPPFLELSQTLWSSSMGHPRDASPRHSPFTGRLSGAYSWPFSIPLPSQIVLDNHGHSSSHSQPPVVPLPPTFAAKTVSSFIDYKIQVVVQRGPLRVDSTLTTSFVYLPRARAPRPSHLLESSYQLHHPILGPSLDPEGWDICPRRTISGILFNSRKASVDCTLALSRPRTYARDCPIHLHFVLESSDSQLLDLLSPSACKIQLLQHIRRQRLETSTHPYTIHKIFKNDSETGAEEVVVTGSCWRSPSPDGTQQHQPHQQYQHQQHQASSQTRRHFEAEIVVRKDLKPSFSFPRFNLQYLVQLSFDATGFVPAQDQPSISESVTIVTDKPRGPAPHSRVPTSMAMSTSTPMDS